MVDERETKTAKAVSAVKREVRALKRDVEPKFASFRFGASGGNAPGGIYPIPTAAEVIGTTSGTLQLLNESGGYVAAANHLTQIVTGDDGDQRIGRKIHVKKVEGSMQLTYTPNNTNSASQSAIVRLALVLDKSPTVAALPTVCSISGDSDVMFQNTHTADDLTKAFPNEKSKRFKVLWDKTITFNPANGFDAAAGALSYSAIQLRHVKFSKKCNFDTTYDVSTTGAYSTCRSNALLLVCGTFQNGTNCTITGQLRTHFEG